MFSVPPIDMFGLPPMRDANHFTGRGSASLPSWANEEHYENCGCFSLLYRIFKK